MTARASGEDPRVAAAGEPIAGDIRPVVALPRGGMPVWVLLLIMALAGLTLFLVLDARRRAAVAPAVLPNRSDRIATPAPPPPLILAQPPRAFEVPQPVQVPIMPAAAPSPRVAPPPAGPSVTYVPQPVPVQPMIPPQMPPQRISAEPALIMDASAPRAAAAAQTGGEQSAAGGGAAAETSSVIGGRARSGALANPATTVPQGTLIPAVLETALDSTRPGLARALVSRDVRGFDGQRVLIPRGSRLIGEYRSDVQPGQRRALVNWTRLIRPDGTTIAIGSPSADPVGRGGINARVNTHFFERFAGAILQSALDIGVTLAASRAASGGFFFYPGMLSSGAAQIVPQRQITPTLSVRQGTSISIFVARDLEFAEARR